MLTNVGILVVKGVIVANLNVALMKSSVVNTIYNAVNINHMRPGYVIFINFMLYFIKNTLYFFA